MNETLEEMITRMVFTKPYPGTISFCAGEEGKICAMKTALGLPFGEGNTPLEALLALEENINKRK